jgi:beta-fructofuranosidase
VYPFRRPTAAAAAGDAIPFAHDGELHLFFLSSPEGTQDYPHRVRTTWQHAVSTDLREWKELTPAVEPGPPGTYDAGGIWTGSVVEHEGRFFLFYTAHDPGSDRPQTIALATSNDLVTFDKHPDNPLLLPTAGYETVDWRDPYVFYNEDEQRWWMLIAARKSSGPMWNRGVIVLATSADLLTWTVEEDPLFDPGDTFCPECPEMWEADGRWYLVYSRFSEQVGTIFRVADSPRGPFRAPARDFVGGRRWYAAKSAPWQGERAFFGWVHDVVQDPSRGRRWLWGGDFALPRLAVVAQTPSGAVMQVRCAALPPTGESVGSVADATVGRIGSHGVLPVSTSVPSRALVEATFTVGDAAGLGIDLVRDESGSVLRCLIDLVRQRVTLTLEPRPLDDFWADLTGSGQQYREIDGPVLAAADMVPGRTRTDATMRWVLDGDVVEIYVDDDVVLTQRVARTAAEQVHAYVLDGTSVVNANVSIFG